VIRHRLAYLWWTVAGNIAHPILRPWLWGGRWETERVIDWYIVTFAGNATHHWAYVEGLWR
jgi:hypothetical protein